MSDNIFEQGTREKVRFETPKGNLTMEDLWIIPLTHKSSLSLDSVAMGLARELKDSGEITSFVIQETKVNNITQLKFDIVLHIIKVRKAESDAANIRRANREKKQQILALIADKENDKLAGQSLEDLKKMAESLED